MIDTINGEKLSPRNQIVSQFNGFSLIVLPAMIGGCLLFCPSAPADNKADEFPALEPADASQFSPALLKPPIVVPKEPDLQSTVPSSMELTASVSQTRLQKYAVVVCSVENRSSIPIIVDGDHAVILVGNAESAIKPASQPAIDAIGRPPTTAGEVFRSDLKATVVAAVTIGAVQTIRGIESERKPVTDRYEWDEERRQHEEERFGVRLLYPGDSTRGNMFFPVQSAPREGMTIACPVKAFYNNANKAMLTGKIGASVRSQIDKDRD